MGTRLSQQKAERSVSHDCEIRSDSFGLYGPPETRCSDPHTLQSLDPRLTAIFPQLYGSSKMLALLRLGRVLLLALPLLVSPAPLYTIFSVYNFIRMYDTRPTSFFPLPQYYTYFLIFSSVVLRGRQEFRCGPLLGIRIPIWFGTKMEIPVGSDVGRMGILSSWKQCLPEPNQLSVPPCVRLVLSTVEAIPDSSPQTGSQPRAVLSVSSLSAPQGTEELKRIGLLSTLPQALSTIPWGCLEGSPKFEGILYLRVFLP